MNPHRACLASMLQHGLQLDVFRAEDIPGPIHPEHAAWMTVYTCCICLQEGCLPVASALLFFVLHSCSSGARKSFHNRLDMLCTGRLQTWIRWRTFRSGSCQR